MHREQMIDSNTAGYKLQARAISGGQRLKRSARANMGVCFDEPTYPVIDKAPHFWKTGDPVDTHSANAHAAQRTVSETRGIMCSRKLQLEGLGNFCWNSSGVLSLWLGSR